MKFAATVWLTAQDRSDVLVDVEPDSTVAELGAEIAKAVAVSPDGIWFNGARLDDTARVGDTRLGEGAELALSDIGMRARHATRGWQLHVIAGTQIGMMWDLPIGTHEIGRTAALQLDDPRASRIHARLEVTAEGARITDHSSNGTTLDGQPVDSQGVAIAPGQLLIIGDSALVVATAKVADAAVQTGPDGVVEFTRSPRIRTARPPSKIVLPAAPEEATRRKIPVVAMVVPLVMGGGLALFSGQLQFLLFTAMSPIMMVSNVITERRASSKQGKETRAAYESRRNQAVADIAAGLAAETSYRRSSVPDAAATVLTASLPTRQLWERRRTDEDSLRVRVGLADQPSELTIIGENASSPSEHRTVYEVPVTLALRDVGVLGVAGEDESARSCARWLLTQLATFHAPRDLSVSILAPTNGGNWAWARWLPHLRPADLDAYTARVGTDQDTVTSRVVELAGLMKSRRDQTQSSGRADRSVFPAHVVVLDGARALRAVPGIAALLADGPDLGIFFICLEQEERLLPEECTATVTLDPDRTGYLAVHAAGRLPRESIRAELMRASEAEQIARGLAPVKDISADDGETTLPSSARLLDILALEPPTVDGLRARWQLGGRTTTMQLGIGADGPFALDLRRDGPHGLIAGTTGSGKSELLQSMIASLAVDNRPDAMNFVLVDYKGGSAFKDCVRLPHTVGMVTDLDAHLVTRALTSLGAELRRREHVLAAASVKDIEDYQDLDARTPGGLTPLPRLLLVIDEFASMARELPDFVTGLVNIAQRGRSLGIHLLLATQRPSGVVSPEIRANTNLRISLRVTDAADSSDVLDASDAARISKAAPGRGFARLGHAALIPFQAGRVGGRRPGVVSAIRRPPFVTELGWGQLGYAPPAGPRFETKEDDSLTDLALLVDVISEAATEEGCSPQPSPWLDALPDRLLLSGLTTDAQTPGGVRLAWGLEDLPAEQSQRTRTLDLTTDGHLLVVGASRSGRSQLLRTLAGSISMLSPDDVHLYGIDCGNGALSILTELPHCGAVITRTEGERAVRLFTRLLNESKRRQTLLTSSGYADVAEQRAASTAADRLPHIVVMLDRWEGFTATLGEVDGGALTEAILGFLREGSSVGIHMVITGDRSLTSARVSSLTESKVALRLADKSDLSLLGLHPREVPDHQPPGRAISVSDSREVQTALLSVDTSGQGQAAALAELGAAAKARHADPQHRPFRVDSLPSFVPLADALAQVKESSGNGRLFVPFGIGGDDLALVGVDLANVPAAIVAGPAKSGRSTLLAFIAQALLDQGIDLIVAAPRPSPLRDLVGSPGVRAVIADPMADVSVWQGALDAPGPVIIIVDDGEGLKDSPGGPLLSSIAKGQAGDLRGLVLSGNAEGICTGFTGWQVDVKRARQGALLSPQDLLNGDLLGVRLPRSAIGVPITPGKALVHVGSGSLVAVTVPR